jgi:hypothetical protein
VTDHCLYGGWSAEGVTRFNALCAIVDEDRKSTDAKKAEDAVLLALSTASLEIELTMEV